MAHEVETMMYVREKPWHGLGTRVEEAPTSADALRLAGLDWKIVQQDIITGGEKIPGYKANVRSTDKAVLGIVSDQYRVVQNTDAFAFTDALIGGDVRYETAGSLCGGKKIFLLARMPERELVGDKVEPYMCFTNTFDGSGAVKCIMTPVRVVCNNTLNLALSTAKRSWSARHVGDLNHRLHEAEICLELADRYLGDLSEEADRLANQRFAEEQLYPLMNELFPTKEDSSKRELTNAYTLRDQFMECYFMPDIKQFRGTAWGFINAAADMAAHKKPLRETKRYQENNMDRIITGHAIVDRAMAIMARAR